MLVPFVGLSIVMLSLPSDGLFGSASAFKVKIANTAAIPTDNANPSQYLLIFFIAVSHTR